jgi:hypothetical protein
MQRDIKDVGNTATTTQKTRVSLPCIRAIDKAQCLTVNIGNTAGSNVVTVRHTIVQVFKLQQIFTVGTISIRYIVHRSVYINK